MVWPFGQSSAATRERPFVEQYQLVPLSQFFGAPWKVFIDASWSRLRSGLHSEKGQEKAPAFTAVLVTADALSGYGRTVAHIEYEAAT
jgi:hypothetical protein